MQGRCLTYCIVSLVLVYKHFNGKKFKKYFNFILFEFHNCEYIGWFLLFVFGHTDCAQGSFLAGGACYLGSICSADSSLQHGLWLNLLPNGKAADGHGFRFHGLKGGHGITQERGSCSQQLDVGVVDSLTCTLHQAKSLKGQPHQGKRSSV